VLIPDAGGHGDGGDGDRDSRSRRTGRPFRLRRRRAPPDPGPACSAPAPRVRTSRGVDSRSPVVAFHHVREVAAPNGDGDEPPLPERRTVRMRRLSSRFVTRSSTGPETISSTRRTPLLTSRAKRPRSARRDGGVHRRRRSTERRSTARTCRPERDDARERRRSVDDRRIRYDARRPHDVEDDDRFVSVP